MKIAVLKERRFNETRVAATPDTVKKLAALKRKLTTASSAQKKAIKKAIKAAAQSGKGQAGKEKA